MKFAIPFLLFIFAVSFSANSQSLSGNVNSSSTSLGYANVDIYKGEKLVASVLTDIDGNFNVKLDTGTYRCEINYIGYKKIVKNIVIKGDEKDEFKMKEDSTALSAVKISSTKRKSPRYRKSAISLDYEMDVSEEYSESEGIESYEFSSGNSNVSAGKLSSGEINDFSKWTLWTDSSSKVLSPYAAIWNLSVSQRFTVQVTDQNNLPLADVLIKLFTADEKLVYVARTDNTGKAELWGSIYPNKKRIEKLNILVDYMGITKKIKNPTEFKNGINYCSYNVECQEYQNVDIAFVVDATGSMGDELEYLKAELNDVIYKSKEISTLLNFKFANVFYRDKGDAYLTQSQPFTRILSESINFINNQSAGGGGDYPEAVDIALDSAINGLEWSDQAIARVLFLILDAPPHNNLVIKEKLMNLSKKAAEKGIRIVPIAASGTDKSTEYLMRNLALATNGTYTFLTNHSGIGNSHIEPTTDQYKVETLNDILVRILKSYSYMPNCEQFIPELNLNYPDSQVTVLENNPEPKDSLINSDSLTSIDSIPNPSFSWKFYPNPTDGIVNIIASKKIEELYITDLSGKVLQLIQGIEPEEIIRVNLSTYATGIYLIRYPIDDRWISGKIVLRR